MDETSIKAGREAKGKMRTGPLLSIYGHADEMVFHYAPSREHPHGSVRMKSLGVSQHPGTPFHDATSRQFQPPGHPILVISRTISSLAGMASGFEVFLDAGRLS